MGFRPTVQVRACRGFTVGVDTTSDPCIEGARECPSGKPGGFGYYALS